MGAKVVFTPPHTTSDEQRIPPSNAVRAGSGLKGQSEGAERSGATEWDTLLGVDERRSFFVDFFSKKVCEFSKRANDLVNVVNELEYRVNLRTSERYLIQRRHIVLTDMKTETILLQLQSEFKDMRQEIKMLKKKLGRPIVEPVIIERLEEKDLTPAQKKRIREVDADVKAGKTNRFVTLEEFGKEIARRKAHPLE